MVHSEKPRRVSLKALESAIASVQQLRNFEHSFEINDLRITLSPVGQEDEIVVQEFAAAPFLNLKEGETTPTKYTDFMDRLRRGTLGFSIVQLGDLNLRGVEVIETDEQDDNGTPISRLKWEVVSEMIARDWSRPMLNHVFDQFGIMLEHMETQASSAIKMDPVDLEEEIERTQRRLTNLLAARKRVEDGPEMDLIQQSQWAAAGKSPPKPEAPEAPVSEEAPRPSPDMSPQGAEVPVPEEGPVRTTPPPTQQGRRSAIPSQAPAPEREPSPEDPQASQGLRDPRTGYELPLDGDTFYDPADPDAALEAETRRQMELHRDHQERKRAVQAQQEARDKAGMQDPRVAARDLARRQEQAERRPGRQQTGQLPGGLREAASTRDAVFDAGAGSVRAGRPQVRPTAPERPGAPARLHGKEVHVMPRQELERPVQQRMPAIDPQGSSVNTRFRRPSE